MTTPAGYSQDNSGHWYYQDGTGPYSISSGGVATHLGGTLVTADSTGFTRQPNGFYFFTDGSGPYVKASDGMYKLLS